MQASDNEVQFACDYIQHGLKFQFAFSGDVEEVHFYEIQSFDCKLFFYFCVMLYCYTQNFLDGFINVIQITL